MTRGCSVPRYLVARVVAVVAYLAGSITPSADGLHVRVAACSSTVWAEDWFGLLVVYKF